LSAQHGGDPAQRTKEVMKVNRAGEGIRYFIRKIIGKKR